MSAIAQITNRCVSVASVSRKRKRESRFAGTFAISASSFFFIFLIDYCGWGHPGMGRERCAKGRVFHHRRRLLSVVVDVAWTKRVWIRAKEVFVRENARMRAFAWSHARDRSRGGYRFPRTPHKIISPDRTCALNEELFFSSFLEGRRDRLLSLSNLSTATSNADRRLLLLLLLLLQAQASLKQKFESAKVVAVVLTNLVMTMRRPNG